MHLWLIILLNFRFRFSFFCNSLCWCRMSISNCVHIYGRLNFLIFVLDFIITIVYTAETNIFNIVLFYCVCLVILWGIVIGVSIIRIIIYRLSINIRKFTHIILLRLIPHRISIQIPIHTCIQTPILRFTTFLINHLNLVIRIFKRLGHCILRNHTTLSLFTES